MLVKIFENVSFRCSEKESPISRFVVAEYAPWLHTDETQAADYEIDFEEATLPESCYRVRPPVTYDDRGVLIFDQQNRILRVDLAQLGSPGCRVQVHPQFNINFFAIILEALLHLAFLRHDAYFCHACSFAINGQVILCPAGRNTGKTNILLAFLLSGADYIGDDWTLVTRSGGIKSLPKRLNLLYYNFQYHPVLKQRMNADQRALVNFAVEAMDGRYDLSAVAIDELKEKSRMRLEPGALDVKTRLENEGIDQVFFLERGFNQERAVEIHDLSRETLCNRVEEIINFEQGFFHLAYSVHKASTGQKNPYFEKQSQRLPILIRESFSKIKPLYCVQVPDQGSSEDVRTRILEKLKA